jgi:hypothetical protein
MLLLHYALEPAEDVSDIVTTSNGWQLPLPPSESSSKGSVTAGNNTSSSKSALDTSGGGSTISSSSGTSVAGSIATAAAAAAGQTLSLRLPFWLEFPSSAAAATACLRVTLLGPFAGRIGQPLALTWQLERISPDSKEQQQQQQLGWAGTAGPQPPAGSRQVPQEEFCNISLQEEPSGARATQVKFNSPEVATLAAAASGGTKSAGGQASTAGRSISLAGLGSNQSGAGSGESDDVISYEVVFDQHPQQQQHPAGSGSADESLGASQAAADEAAASRASWLQGSPPTGNVRLGRSTGSLATVEVLVVPQAAGKHALPRLLLKSLAGNQVLQVDQGPAAPGREQQGILIW